MGVDWTVKVDWNSDGDYTDPTEDLSALGRVKDGVTITYGRDQARALAPIAPGEASFTLNNVSRDYLPENTASPLYGTVFPGRDVTIEATLNAQPAVGLLAGSIDGFEVLPDINDRLVRVTCNDALGRLRGLKVSTRLYQGITSGEAVNALLDAVGWPTSLRDIDRGASTFPWWWESDADAWEALMRIVDSEGPTALVAVDVARRITFRDRHHRVRQLASKQLAGYARGINVTSAADPTLGTYGTDYYFDSQASLNYLAGRGHTVVRVAFRWENLQTTLGAALDATELTRLQQMVTRVQAAGMRAILNPQNFGYYNGNAIGSGSGPTQAQFVDLWSRLSTAFKGNAGVYAYDLMNEPHDLPDGQKTVLNATTHFTFDATSQGWVGAGGTTVARDTAVLIDGAGTLKLTKTMGAVDGMWADDAGGTANNLSALGNTLTCKVKVPSGALGSNWKVRFNTLDSTLTWQAGGWWDLVKGTTHDIFHSPTAEQLYDCRGIALEFSATGVNATQSVNIDTVKQGTYYEDSGRDKWQAASQAAVSAVRTAGDLTLILVGGYQWSSVYNWTTNNPAPWVKGANVAYTAHMYFDTDHSGNYADTYDTTATAAVSAGYADLPARLTAELNVWLAWLALHKVGGFLGEVGWPKTDSRWNTLGELVYDLIDVAQVGAAYWDAGQWRGTTYALTAYQGTSTSTPLSSATQQATIIEAHPSTLAWWSGSVEPAMSSPVGYDHGWRDIVNDVAFDVPLRTSTGVRGQVWQMEGLQYLEDGEILALSATSSDPFRSALTPVEGTDYTLQSGVVSVWLSRTSGQSLTVYVQAVGGPAVIDGMQVRARTITTAVTVQVTAEDATSVGRYGRQSLPDGRAPVWASLQDVKGIAQMILGQRGERLPTLSVTFKGAVDERLVQQLGRDLSDRVRITEAASMMDADFFIERIEHTIGGLDHQTIFGCEKAPSQVADVFVLGSATNGILGTNRLGRRGIDDPSRVFVLGSATNGILGTNILAL